MRTKGAEGSAVASHPLDSMHELSWRIGESQMSAPQIDKTNVGKIAERISVVS